MIFATHSVVTAADCPLGYLLLRCIRAFLVVDMYTGFEVHTDDTLAQERESVQAYGNLIQVSNFLLVLSMTANKYLLCRSISKRPPKTKALEPKTGTS